MSTDNELSSDDNYSDVSLDEDDEELIWRVFYNDLDRKHEHDSYEQNLDSEDSDILGGEEIEDISDLSEIEDEELVNKYLKLKSSKLDRSMNEEEKKRLLVAHFSDDQMERFEAYRRMTVNKPGVKKICNSVLAQSIPQNLAIVLAGISKSFLGEIITRAFEVQERENHSKLILDIDDKKRQKRSVLKSLENGKEVELEDKKLQYGGDSPKPLQPHHIREAYRLYKLENSGAFDSQWRREGDADGRLFR